MPSVETPMQNVLIRERSPAYVHDPTCDTLARYRGAYRTGHQPSFVPCAGLQRARPFACAARCVYTILAQRMFACAFANHRRRLGGIMNPVSYCSSIGCRCMFAIKCFIRRVIGVTHPATFVPHAMGIEHDIVELIVIVSLEKSLQRTLTLSMGDKHRKLVAIVMKRIAHLRFSANTLQRERSPRTARRQVVHAASTCRLLSSASSIKSREMAPRALRESRPCQPTVGRKPGYGKIGLIQGRLKRDLAL
jgi:hypothetical protein